MKPKPASLNNLPVMLFKQQKIWAAWLGKNHARSQGIWMRIAKKGAKIASVTYEQAVEVALCYGWIDGQKQKYDAATWLQKFTPRGMKSGWSKINRDKAEELIRRGKMRAAGRQAVDDAKRNGRWDAAYDSQSRATVPSDLQAELDRHPKAKAFFATLNSVNRYAILYRIQTAKKAETRRQRIEKFIRMLDKHEKIYP